MTCHMGIAALNVFYVRLDIGWAIFCFAAAYDYLDTFKVLNTGRFKTITNKYSDID